MLPDPSLEQSGGSPERQRASFSAGSAFASKCISKSDAGISQMYLLKGVTLTATGLLAERLLL